MNKSCENEFQIKVDEEFLTHKCGNDFHGMKRQFLIRIFTGDNILTIGNDIYLNPVLVIKVNAATTIINVTAQAIITNNLNIFFIY